MSPYKKICFSALAALITSTTGASAATMAYVFTDNAGDVDVDYSGAMDLATGYNAPFNYGSSLYQFYSETSGLAILVRSSSTDIYTASPGGPGSPDHRSTILPLFTLTPTSHTGDNFGFSAGVAGGSGSNVLTPAGYLSNSSISGGFVLASQTVDGIFGAGYFSGGAVEVYNDGVNSITFHNTVLNAVPEPTSLVLVALGAASLGLRRRRR